MDRVVVLPAWACRYSGSLKDAVAQIDLAGLAQVIAFMGEAGQLKAPLPEPERFVELRYQRLASHPQQ